MATGVLRRGWRSIVAQLGAGAETECSGLRSQVRTFCASVTRSPFRAERVKRPRGTLWKSRKVLSNESLTVIRRIIRHQDDEAELGRIIKNEMGRLLKMDTMAVFKELIRERRGELAHMVFNSIKKESWYKPELFMYKDLLFVYAKKHKAQIVEELFEELKNESGLEPELNCYTELLRAYIYTSQVDKVHRTVDEMKATGCLPDLPVYRLLCVGLSSVGEREAAMKYRMELYHAQHEQAVQPLVEEKRNANERGRIEFLVLLKTRTSKDSFGRNTSKFTAQLKLAFYEPGVECEEESLEDYLSEGAKISTLPNIGLMQLATLSSVYYQ